MSNPKPYHHQHGLTLVEAVITLTIAAILFTWAVPSLQDFITRNRMSTEVNYFTASLYFARSEAVKRLQNVRLCPSTNGTACDGGSNWHQGWMVYAEVNGNATFDPGVDTVLQINPALPTQFEATGARSVITFLPTGQSTGSNDTFKFCDTKKVADQRKIILSNVGRVRTEKIASTQGCA